MIEQETPLSDNTVHTRLDAKLIGILDEYREIEECTTTDAVRRLLRYGYTEWQRERAYLEAHRAAR